MLISYFPLKKLFFSSQRTNPASSQNTLIKNFFVNTIVGVIGTIAGYIGFSLATSNMPNVKRFDCKALEDTNEHTINSILNHEDGKKYGIIIGCIQNYNFHWFERPFLPLFQKKGSCKVVGFQR